MTDKAYTNVTADDWVSTDPTPRTAATARERVEEEREHLVALEMADRFAIAIGGTAELSEDDFRAALDHLIALAAAEAPGRVAALEAALGDAIEAAWCVATSGGTGGKWCVNHDVPMDTETECHWLSSLRVCLAAPASPAGVSGECVGCAEQGIHHPRGTHHPYRSSALVAHLRGPRPEGERCVYLISSGTTRATCHYLADSIIHDHNETCDGRPGGRWHVPCDSCHPFTPATHAPSEPVGRCERGVYAVHAGIPIVVTCGETHDAETHEQGAPDYDHPFTPAARG